MIQDLAKSLLSLQAIDLSPTLERGIPRWPTHPHFVLDPTVVHKHDGYYCQSVSMAEHTGCHVDAPCHVHADLMDQTIDKVPLTQIIGRAVVYHFGPLHLEPGDTVTAQQIVDYEERTGVAVGEGEIALLDFDWMKYWTITNEAHWYATNEPGLDETAVKLFYDRGVKAVGSDTIACDTAVKDGQQLAAFGHEKYWLRNGVLIMESLNNLDKIETECLFVATPLKLFNGSGSPIRPVAFV